MCFCMNSAKIQRIYMNSVENKLTSAFNRMNSAQKRNFLSTFSLLQREKHRKNLKSARNKRYYQHHKDKILEKQSLKNKLYADFIQRH